MDRCLYGCSERFWICSSWNISWTFKAYVSDRVRGKETHSGLEVIRWTIQVKNITKSLFVSELWLINIHGSTSNPPFSNKVYKCYAFNYNGQCSKLNVHTVIGTLTVSDCILWNHVFVRIAEHLTLKDKGLLDNLFRKRQAVEVHNVAPDVVQESQVILDHVHFSILIANRFLVLICSTIM